MAEPRKQHITLQLDAHHISLNVVADKEALYRNAAEQINERYRHYRKMLPNHSAEQIWVYVALEMAVNLQADAHAHRLQPVDEKIQEITKIIQQTLNNKQL